MAGPARDTLTLLELFQLFHRDGDPGHWLSMSDSIEYLNVVTYIVVRNQREADNS